eukprot:6416876-Amphidinium_carterae.1
MAITGSEAPPSTVCSPLRLHRALFPTTSSEVRTFHTRSAATLKPTVVNYAMQSTLRARRKVAGSSLLQVLGESKPISCDGANHALPVEALAWHFGHGVQLAAMQTRRRVQVTHAPCAT